jgi:hypothetical protein
MEETCDFLLESSITSLTSLICRDSLSLINICIPNENQVSSFAVKNTVSSRSTNEIIERLNIHSRSLSSLLASHIKFTSTSSFPTLNDQNSSTFFRALVLSNLVLNLSFSPPSSDSIQNPSADININPESEDDIQFTWALNVKHAYTLLASLEPLETLRRRAVLNVKNPTASILKLSTRLEKRFESLWISFKRLV